MAEIQGIAPPDTSPDKAIPLPLPSMPSPPPAPTLSTLRAWIPVYLKRTDVTVEHLGRILSTPGGTDTFLLTICYTSLLSSKLLASVSLHQLHKRIKYLTSAVSSLPADTTLVIETPAVRLLRLSQSLKALSSLISDYRIFVRLWGLLGIYRWAKGLVAEPPADAVQRRIAWAQVAVNVAFQYLENAAYLASKGVLGWDERRQTRAWLWSSRFWAAHVALDLYRLAYELRTAKQTGGDKVQEEPVKAKWTRQLATNLAWAPLTLHWSRETGLLGDLGVGLLGTAAGLVDFRERWKDTA
ncbi:MAG: hypothetical protein M1818_005972 [Claussenomyces sp. TS43310]|nr:MAG: hypothetical protein M1818_005972 [Claussenomyces sp. TS43310]